MTERPFAHAGLAMMVAKRFYIEGMDLEDLYQEACFAMFRAEPKWDPARGKISTFLYQCAWSHLNVERRKSRAGKRIPASEIASLDATYAHDGGSSLGDLLGSYGSDPAVIVEQRDEIRRALNEPSLTHAERVCLFASAVGVPPHEAGYHHEYERLARHKANLARHRLRPAA